MFSFYCLPLRLLCTFLFFFFNDTATTEIYTLSLHDALPILVSWEPRDPIGFSPCGMAFGAVRKAYKAPRSEEHTSELQSLRHLVCRLLLEKKKQAVNADASEEMICSDTKTC